MRKKQISKYKNFTANTQYLNLKAPRNNVKMQSDKTLSTQIHLNLNQMEIFLNDNR